MYHGCEWAELEVLAKPLIYGRRHHTKYARNTHIIDVLWVLTLCKWAKREILAKPLIYGYRKRAGFIKKCMELLSPMQSGKSCGGCCQHDATVLLLSMPSCPQFNANTTQRLLALSSRQAQLSIKSSCPKFNTRASCTQLDTGTT